MKRSFTLKSKPFSINSAFYSDARTKTAEVREWAAQIFHQLWSADNQGMLKELREFFDESKHSIKVEIKAVYPKEQFITQQNVLSARTIDCSNFEKLIVDLFFDKQYHDKKHPYGAPNLNINDKHVVSLYSHKTFHEEAHHNLIFTVKIVPRKF